MDSLETINELVTIIIPTYNRISTFKGALESAQKQTYCRLEILILDNSEDNKVKDYLMNVNDTRIRFIKHPSNIGLIMNIAYGFCVARGAFLCLLGDDDIMAPEFVSTGVNLLKQHSSANGISFAYETFQENFHNVRAWNERNEYSNLELAEISHISNKQRKINFCSSLFRSCIKEKMNLAYYAGLALDTALLADLILDEKLLYSDMTLYNYRVHLGQASNKQGAESIIDEIYVYEKILNRQFISKQLRIQLTHNLIHSYICLRDKIVIHGNNDIPIAMRSINKRLLQLDVNSLKRLLPFIIGDDMYKYLCKVAYRSKN